MNEWDPPTEEDMLLAAGLRGRRLERATAAIDVMELHGMDRKAACRSIGQIATAGFVGPRELRQTVDGGYDLEGALYRFLPSASYDDLMLLVRHHCLTFEDVLDAIVGPDDDGRVYQ